MAFCFHADASEHGQPSVAEGSVLRGDDIVPKLQASTATRHEGGAVVQIMLGADVAAVGEGDVVEEAAAIGFLGGLQTVDEAGEEFALRKISALRGLEFLAHRGVVVAHVVRSDFYADAGEERADGLAIGHDAGAVGAHRSDHDVVHDLDLFSAGEAGRGLGQVGLRLRHAQPLLVLAQPDFNLADTLEIFVELLGVVLGEITTQVARVLDDVKRLVDAGVAEVSLLGQNVNAYHGLDERGASVGLRGLVERLATLAGLERIRYTTSHPNDFDDDLIAAHAEIDKLMPFVHLPVQSGSDRILKAMNRKHTAAQYFAIIDRLRVARPDIALSSDFIVGFPGETEADVEATLDLIRRTGMASAFSFKYSPRPGTKAAELVEQVPEAVKSERLARLQRLEEDQRRAFNQATVGRVVGVLFEKQGRHPGQIGGKSPYMQAVHVDGPLNLVGRVAPVKILSLKTNSLAGELA